MPTEQRERERKIFEAGRRENKSDDFIREAIVRDRSKRKTEAQPQEVKQPSLVRRAAGGAANLARTLLKPAVTVAARPTQLGRALLGATPEQQALNVPFIGRIEAPRTGKDIVRDIGRVAETAALGVGGGAVPSVLRQVAKGGIARGAVRGAQAGAAAGALGGAGRQVKETGEIGRETAISAGVEGLLGTATGAALGS